MRKKIARNDEQNKARNKGKEWSRGSGDIEEINTRNTASQCPWPCVLAAQLLFPSRSGDTSNRKGGFSGTFNDVKFKLYPIWTLRRRKTLVVHLCNVRIIAYCGKRGSGRRFSPTSPSKHLWFCACRQRPIKFPQRNTSGLHYGKRCVSTSVMTERALPYQEPGITALLTLSSFLCLLNVINHLLDKWIYCGLLGQVFVGVVWGLPGAQWISNAIQEVFTQLGSLGLVLLVYEGNRRTSTSSPDWMNSL
jgi:hypothetical protein